MKLNTTQKALSLFVGMMLLGACSANANGVGSGQQADTEDSWKHDQLQSAEGVNISIDYQIAESHPGGDPNEIIIQATPAWMNVTFPGQCPAGARVVISTFLGNPGQFFDEIDSKQVDLTLQPGECRFSAEIGKLEEATGNESGGNNAGQKISIVADGNWLTDPVSGSHDFQIHLQ